MEFRDTFLKNKNKHNHALDEHYKNLTSLQKRLGAIGSVSHKHILLYTIARRKEEEPI